MRMDSVQMRRAMSLMRKSLDLCMHWSLMQQLVAEMSTLPQPQHVPCHFHYTFDTVQHGNVGS